MTSSTPVEPRAHGISKTAIWVAAARAIGAREPDARVRNPDRLAEALLGDPSKLELDHPVVGGLSLGYEEAMQNIEIADTVRAMIERTRFIDEALERAIADGVTQVLVAGAGLDSHAYRFAEQLGSARVFEADRPATIGFKQRRVAEALGAPPSNLSYVPIDYQHQDAAAELSAHGYDPSRKTFVIMEGVTMYLPEDALRAALRFVAAHAPGSRIVFDFASRPIVDGFRNIDISLVPEAARPAVQRMINLFRDEPWLFGFEPGGEAAYLAELGLGISEILTIGSEESVRRYLTRADGTQVGAEAHAKALAMRQAIQARATAGLSEEARKAAEEQMRERQRQMSYRIAEASVSSSPVQ